jgi:hypothetical protein
MDATEYRLLTYRTKTLEDWGLSIITRHDAFYVRANKNHPDWLTLGLVEDNELSGGLRTFEEAYAWATGFIQRGFYEQFRQQTTGD